MQKQPRFLITTADERTWKFDRPVIFLGEWCRLYNRRHIWEDMDAIVARPYGLGVANKDVDYAEARTLEDMLLPMLCNTLNQHHGIQYSERFWQIVLGHWLRRYVDVMLNRVNTLDQCIKQHEISGFIAYANDDYALTTPDSYSAIFACNDDQWNNALTARILNCLGELSFPIEVIDGCRLPQFSFKALAVIPSFKKTVLKWGYHQFVRFARFFLKDNDAFIINSYLPIKEVIKLELALGQCPQLWFSPKLELSEKSDRELRKRLAEKFSIQSGDGLEIILSLMLFELLPVCYLEGFANLKKIVKQQSWPNEPKFIFTSNNFDTDEVFKLWAAIKVEACSKYFIGQHGNNYGTCRYFPLAIEEATADKFLTWGWTDGLPQHTPAFMFKTAGRKAVNCNLHGGLLLIELPLGHRITTWDSTFEFVNYFEDQQKFVNELAITPKKNLTIRLHSAYKYQKWNEEARWQAFDSALKIDTGSATIRDLLAQSRLVVHSYDSTGILETLSQNIPTLAFWQNGFDHLRESAKPYYQLLVDAGVVHFSPKSIAQKVNEIWDDVDGWWGQDDVQDARLKFIERYARIEPRPAKRLITILME